MPHEPAPQPPDSPAGPPLPQWTKSAVEPARSGIRTRAIVKITLACLFVLSFIGGAIIVVNHTRGPSGPPGAQPPGPVTPSAVPSPSAGLPFEIVKRTDTTQHTGAKSLYVLVEIRQYPVTRDDLITVATRVAESHRGQGWLGIGMSLVYDRREVHPAFARVVWAPGGDWVNLKNGDPQKWQGYQVGFEYMQRKVSQPADCTVPTDQAYPLYSEFKKAAERGYPDAVLPDLVKRYQLPETVIRELVLSVEHWVHC